MGVKEKGYRFRPENVDPNRLIRILTGWNYEDHLFSYRVVGEGQRENERREWIFTSPDEKLKLSIDRQKPVGVGFIIGRFSQFSTDRVKSILAEARPNLGWIFKCKGLDGLVYDISTNGDNRYQSEMTIFKGRDRIFRLRQEIDLRKKIIVVEDGNIRL